MRLFTILVICTVSLPGNFAGAAECNNLPESQAIDFLGRDLERNDIHLSDYNGKIVVVSFWASWCPPCLEELPMLEILQREGGKERIEVIAINFNEDSRTIRRFLHHWGVESQMTIARDYKRHARKSFGVDAIPATFIFNSTGELESSHCGYSKKSFIELVEELNALILHKQNSEPDDRA